MKKVVNNVIIDIDNIALFEKAEEGAILSKQDTTKIYCNLSVDKDLVNDIIEQYEIYYKAIPYPLDHIESNIRYVTVGVFIRDRIDKELHMWVDRALFICLDEERSIAIKFVGDTWSFVNTNCKREDNIDMNKFRSDIGYTEYSWVLDKILSNNDIDSFYECFMPEFVRACNNNSVIMQSEMRNMLSFGHLPSRVKLINNKIINLDSKSEYIIDVYVSGLKSTGENRYVMSLSNDDMALEPTYTEVYGFSTYEKEYSKGKLGKLKESSLVGMKNVFNTLCSIKMSSDKDSIEEFTGFIVDRDLVYVINNRIFVCKAFRLSESKEICSGVDFYSYDKGMIYFVKTVNIGKGVKKQSIYSYSIRNDRMSLCKIQFEV